MAYWQKDFYAPASGAWHDILTATADCKLSFCQLINISPTDSCRAIIAIGATDDVAILAPTGLACAQTGAVGTASYEYVVTAVKADGRETEPSAAVEINAVGADALSADNYHTLSWSAVTNAAKYRVYCRMGGADSAVIKVAEVTALTYANKGAMSAAEKWPWVNMTAVKSMLAWADLPPGTGLEPISRPVPFASGAKVRLFTTGQVSLYASGEV
ncbi:hypothetical protein [Cloacibacillus evryensis]|uniref:hypothetical protein n=1 Tax=Cloacibacillus evryensis TaxID=508460 RepID=UPI002B1F612A|nr:hypothetical protein [Cloacibacillus evryensis]MEA5034240.1 hypothetical protein [Cloacibacillus evryensis]